MRVSETESGGVGGGGVGGGGGGVVAHHEGACLHCCNNLKTCPQCGAYVRSMHDKSE